VRIIARGIRNLLTNFDVSGTFRSRLVRRTTWHRDLNLWPCWWGFITAIRVFVLRLYAKLEVRRPFRSEDYDALPVSALVGLVTLTFDVWPRNWCTLLPVGWTTFLPILVSLVRFVLDLSVNTCQTRHVTLRPWPLTFVARACCCWCGSVSSVYVPSLKFVWLSR